MHHCTKNSHVHHDRVHHWFSTLKRDRFATCVLTQGTLLRVHMKAAFDGSAHDAWRSLKELAAHPKHEWWGDSLSFLQVPHRNLQGSIEDSSEVPQVSQVWRLRSEASWTSHNGSSVNFLGDGTIFWGDGTV